jgi:hypothetical protein
MLDWQYWPCIIDTKYQLVKRICISVQTFVVLQPYQGGNFDRKTTKVLEELNGYEFWGKM